MNPSYKLGKKEFTGENRQISKNDFDKYIARRDIEGLSNQWQNQCMQWLKDYLDIVSWKVDEELVKKARDHGLVISKFLENQLRGYFNFIDGRHTNYSQTNNTSNESGYKNKDGVGLSVSITPNRRKINQENGIFTPSWFFVSQIFSLKPFFSFF